MKNFYFKVLFQWTLFVACLLMSLLPVTVVKGQTCNTPAPKVVSPVYYCQNESATPLTATGTNLSWGTPIAISGSAGGTSNLTVNNWVEWQWSNIKTNFTTTETNVKITSVDYYIQPYQNVTDLVLAIYNSAGTKIATSSTKTSQTAGSSLIKITNTFNYNIAAAGNYSIGVSAGYGTIGGDQPTNFPIKEATGTINVTGYTSGAYRNFNNIKFTVTKAVPAPTPVTTKVGTINYIVTQTVNGCISPQATIAVIVTAPPSATISYTGTPYCSSEGTATVTRTGSAGGTYSSTTLGTKINAATGAITLASVPAGTHKVTYTVAATGGCAAYSATTNVTVTVAPSATISYSGSPYCTSEGTATVTRTGTAGGTYSCTTLGTKINATTGAITLASAPAGTHTVTYTVAATGGCAVYSATTNVTVAVPSSATISYSGSPFCSTSGTASVTRTGTAGGTYSSTNGLSINSSTGLIDLSASTTGTYTVTYTVGASGACSVPATTTVQIAPLSNNEINFTNGLSGVICATANENSTATLTAPAGTVFTSVGFASYGNPSGTCPSYIMGTCHAATSQSKAESYLLGNNTAGIPATNAVFGDPCSGTAKRLYVQATYTQAVCTGTSAGIITGTTPSGSNGTYSYYWEKSTTSSSAGFTAAPGTNNTKDYAPGILTQNTWYRRTVTSRGCTDISSVILITVIPAPNVSGTSTPTCVGGSTGEITATAGGGTAPYTYSLNGGDYQTANKFSGLAAGSYTLNVKTTTGCIASATVTVSPFTAATDDQSRAGNNSWIGHVYDGTNFNTYVGQYNETETFNQNFGGSTSCFNVTSNSVSRSIYTESFSVKYKMNSTKNGLYIVDLGSDDGSRLTVDGTLIYNNWSAQSFSAKPRVLINLNGSSSLIYDYYEDGGDNQAAFQNLTLVLANTLTTNTTQNICIGKTGSAIGGDAFGTLPAGITLTGTGYQWSYSTAPGGTRVNIAGATGAAFTPSATVAPFNTPGTYYIYRSASVSSANNTGVNPYIATNVSNAATIVVPALTTATISYSGSPYCSSAGTANVTLSGPAGGVYSSSSNVSINAATGAINLANSVAGTHEVKYTGSTSCGTYTATTRITITTQPFVTGNFPGNPYCTNFGIAYPTGSKAGADGFISAQPGLSINSSTAVVDLGASTPGDYTLYYTVPASGGCAAYTATYNLIIIGSPTAAISYPASTFCTTAGLVAVTRTGNAGGKYSAGAGLSINATTGEINTVTSTAGTYTVTYSIAAAGSCKAVTATTTITITAIGTWTGNVSADWNNAANWTCNIIPAATTDVTISATTRQPVITAKTAIVKNLTIKAGAMVMVNKELQILGNITNSGSISAENGIINMDGSAAQVIPANLFKNNVVKDLVIDNAAGVTLAGAVNLTDELSITGGSLNTGGFLTLKSTAAGTAKVTEIKSVSANPIVGNVTVERFVTPKRAYRFLTVPVNTPGSVKANWMENTNNATPWVNNDPVANYGTHITGAGGDANGFDATNTNNASLFTFNNQTQGWVAAPNTNGTLNAGNAYRIMVRGSRSANLNSNEATPSETTLRATGTLVTGVVKMTKPGGGGTPGMPELTTTKDGYNLIGNPYASVVDWKKVTLKDINKTLYYFDPTIQGSNNRGGYISFNILTDVLSNLKSKANNQIQSGQAFFVQTSGSNPSITFEEKDKSKEDALVFRGANERPRINVQLLLRGQEETDQAADGLAAYFSEDYSNAIGEEDSYKFSNQDENIAIMRNGTALSIEGRKPVAISDTIPLKIWQLSQKSYTFRVSMAKFTSNVKAYLEDAYLQTSTPLANDAETLVPFTLTSDAASSSQQRFSIVFESFATLPVQLAGVKAYEKNKGVQVEWIAASESNMDRYEVERSATATDFKTIGSVKAKDNPGLSTEYSFYDPNPNPDNYYRIRSVDKSGEIKYTEIVNVRIGKRVENITVFPNPVRGKVINIVFNNKEKGTYLTSLTNNSGQKIYNSRISHGGGSANHEIKTNVPLPAGVYQLLVTKGDATEKIVVLVQ